MYGELAPAAFEDIGPQPACPACGYGLEGAIKRVVVAEDSIPDDVDIFRLRNGPTQVVVTEGFMDAVHELELTGLEVQEVEVRAPAG